MDSGRVFSDWKYLKAGLAELFGPLDAEEENRLFPFFAYPRRTTGRLHSWIFSTERQRLGAGSAFSCSALCTRIVRQPPLRCNAGTPEDIFRSNSCSTFRSAECFTSFWKSIWTPKQDNSRDRRSWKNPTKVEARWRRARLASARRAVHQVSQRWTPV